MQKKLQTKLIIVTDTQETLWINVFTGNNVKDEKGNNFKYLFNPKDENLPKVITEIIQSINGNNDKILPKQLIDPTGLAKQIWQDVWSVSGATPENCLYTFVGLFMEWIVRALKPHGKAFIIVPDGIFNRQNDKNLRQFILENCFIDAIISLPVKTFFATSKKTYILAITKKHNISQIQTDPVFTYLCSEIGESRDIYRFDIEQNDLKEAVNLFNAFKGSKKYFASIDHDKRCKIQSIERFRSNVKNHWIIDKDWSEKEKIELNITQKTEQVSLVDFLDFVRDGAANIQNYSSTLSEITTNVEEKTHEKEGYVELSIEKIFAIEKGKARYTKEFMNKNKGNYPVYSSQTFDNGIISSICTYDYDCECLTWTTDGTYVGTVFTRKGKFSMTTHCGGLFLKPEYKGKILLEYLYYTLNNVLPLYKDGEGSNKRLGTKKIREISIKIPITPTGEFDLKKQKEIAEKYCKIEEFKKNIKAEVEKIENIKVDIDL